MIRARVIAITAQPKLIASGAVQVLRMAGGGDRVKYYFGGQHCKAGVVDLPRFKAAIAFSDNGWSGGVTPTTGVLRWAPSMAADYNSFASSYLWKDAAVEVYLGLEGHGGEEPSAWTTVLNGAVADVSAEEGIVSFTIADLSAKLDKPLAAGTFAGTGGIEGPVEATGRTKRRSWGAVWNVEGRILDKANSIWEFGDPAFPLQSFRALRDMGLAASPAPTVLAWQGSIAATFAALQAAVCAPGSGVVAPSIACAKWWMTPKGPLTADLQGENTGGYADTVTGIATKVLAAMGGPALSALSAAVAAHPLATMEAGLHTGDSGMTTAQALDRLFLGGGGVWILDPAGTVRIAVFSFANPVETIDSDTVSRVRVSPPVKLRRLGYKRNEREHGDGEISAPILAAEVENLGDLALKDVVALGAEVVRANGVTPVTDAMALNQYLSVANNGSFLGGGGGQVTYAGLGGAALGLKPSLGWGETGFFTGRPANLAALAGSEGINNQLLSVAANGAFLGGAGGQVDLRALGYIGALNAGVVLDIYLPVVSSGPPTIRGTSITGTGIWTPYCSRESIKGPVFASWSFDGGLSICGLLNYVPSSLAEGQGGAISLYSAGGGGVALWISGYTLDWGFTTCVPTDVFTMRLDDVYLHIEKNGAVLVSLLLSQIGFAPNQTWRVGGTIYGGTTSKIKFGPANDAKWATLATSRPANLAELVGSEGIKNQLLSVASNGAFLGGAGGQVTWSGLGGAALGLKASLGWGETSFFTGRPANLAALGGGEGINNQLLSLATNGAFLGGAGGQVTLAGIDSVGVIPRTSRLSQITGRIADPTLFHTAAILGRSNTTNLVPSYTQNGANWTVSLPAHVRKIIGPAGTALALNYGAGSGVVGPNVVWIAYIIDAGLTGIATPIVNFTTNPDDLLQIGAYEVAAGLSPASYTPDPPPPETGGGGGGWRVNQFEMPD